MGEGTGVRDFRVGDCVIYCVKKNTPHPGRRARAVSPSARGEYYSYSVDKQWIVRQLRDDGRLVLETRRGKQRVISSDDPALRHASLWERWRLRDRFPNPQRSLENSR